MKSVVIYSKNGLLRAFVKGVLSGTKLEIREVASREKLFDLCRKSKFELLLTDDVMMFVNGSEAMGKIRCGDALPQIFILSHNLSEDCVMALLEMGINQFISLPLSPERLRNKVLAQRNFCV
ncbi:MAG: response regulator [Alistipes sp.]|nr:response regulator [Alistipes sp.]